MTKKKTDLFLSNDKLAKKAANKLIGVKVVTNCELDMSLVLNCLAAMCFLFSAFFLSTLSVLEQLAQKVHRKMSMWYADKRK